MRAFAFLWKLFYESIFSQKKFTVLLFGLGNSGEQYLKTRHNIGFRIIDTFQNYLIDRKPVSFSDAEVITGKIAPEIYVATIKPLLFMNRSGFTVATALKKWKIPQNKCLVILDDFNLPFGSIRARRNGSHGGHNGLKSIIEQIGPEFPRLRIGIGPLPEKTGIIDFVLGNFTESEEIQLKRIFTNGHEILKTFAADGIEAVMNKYN